MVTYSWGVIFCHQLVSLCCLELLLRYAVGLFFVRLFNVIGNFWQGVLFDFWKRSTTGTGCVSGSKTSDWVGLDGARLGSIFGTVLG